MCCALACAACLARFVWFPNATIEEPSPPPVDHLPSGWQTETRNATDMVEVPPGVIEAAAASTSVTQGPVGLAAAVRDATECLQRGTRGNELHPRFSGKRPGSSGRAQHVGAETANPPDDDAADHTSGIAPLYNAASPMSRLYAGQRTRDGVKLVPEAHPIVLRAIQHSRQRLDAAQHQWAVAQSLGKEAVAGEDARAPSSASHDGDAGEHGPAAPPSASVHRLWQLRTRVRFTAYYAAQANGFASIFGADRHKV